MTRGLSELPAAGDIAPLFSVVIPVKDRCAFLYRALHSLRVQTYRGFEVVVVDDGSTEDVEAVVRRFPELDIRYVAQVAGVQGACAARNLGSDVARGTYVAYLDSDDIFLRDKLEVVSRLVQASGPDLIASHLLVYRAAGADLPLRPGRRLLPEEEADSFYFVHDERIQSSSIVISRELFRSVRWNNSLRKVQDPDFFIRASKAARMRSFIDTPLAVLFDDLDGGRVSSRSAEANLRDWLGSDACPLSPRARKGFSMYALSFEVSKRSRISAALMILGNCTGFSPRIVLKALTRALVPEACIKFLLRISRARKRPGLPAEAAFIGECIARAKTDFEQTAGAA